jgi:hypothetical protein
LASFLIENSERPVASIETSLTRRDNPIDLRRARATFDLIRACNQAERGAHPFAYPFARNYQFATIRNKEFAVVVVTDRFCAVVDNSLTR